MNKVPDYSKYRILYPVFEDSKYGCIDGRGTIRVETIYDEIHLTIEPRIVLGKKEGLWYEIFLSDDDTVKITEVPFESSRDIQEIALLGDDMYAFFLLKENRKDDLVFEGSRAILYDKAGIFKNSELQGNCDFRTLYTSNDRVIFSDDQGRYGIADRHGKIILESHYDFIGMYSSEGLAIFRETIDGSRRSGFLDIDGNVSIEPVYWYAMNFSENRAAVADRNEMWHIRPDGNRAYSQEIRFREVSAFSEGLAFAQPISNSLYGYINFDGRFVIKPRYFSASVFREGIACVGLEEPQNGLQRVGYINSRGKVIFSIRQVHEGGLFYGPLAFIVTDDTYGYINKKGRFVWKCQLVDNAKPPKGLEFYNWTRSWSR